MSRRICADCGRAGRRCEGGRGSGMGAHFRRPGGSGSFSPRLRASPWSASPPRSPARASAAPRPGRSGRRSSRRRGDQQEERRLDEEAGPGLSKTSSLSSQATPSMTRISARKAKTPAATPTAEPRRSLPTFSETSALASSISSRISVDVVRRRRRRARRPTSGRAPAGCRGRLGHRLVLLRRLFVEEPAPEQGRDPRGERCWRARCLRRASRSRRVV